MHRVLQVLSLVVVATATGISGAFAAPQILALLETPEPTPLACAGGVCQAEFSTMCLQKNREIPQPGTAYAPATPDSVVLVLTRADGTTTRVVGAPGLRFVVPHNYLSAVATISEAAIRQLGATRAALEIAPLASLIPEAIPGDTSPVSAEEIATVTGPLRMAAHRVAKRARDTISAVRAANRFANALLVTPATTQEERLAMWHDIVAASGTDATAAGIARIDNIIDTCQFYDEHRGFEGFRGCLRYRRDLLLESINDTYWRRKDLGS
ncbi:MAG TPA: hypothetical protein VF987_10455 [Rhodospirillales bacterium]